MPLKGSGTVLKEEDCAFRAECMEVQCRVCNARLPEKHRVWLLARNGVRHLQSDEHKNTVEQMEDAQRMEEQRHAAVTQNVPIWVVQIPTPIADRPTGHMRAQRSLRCGPTMRRMEQLSVQGILRMTWRQHIRGWRSRRTSLACWIRRKMAERLGFEGDVGPAKLLQIEAEDDFLAEIMANAGLSSQYSGQYATTACLKLSHTLDFPSIQGLNLDKDWANLAVRAQMHVYPEILEDSVVQEIWHTLKWRNISKTEFLWHI
ncbi:hypothetical protein B0H13DRAFT_1884978 [Mycena leptocephala]|nr:hypothetical protein B0H13DRAFT_1884978 [Mycena leptocephala]